MLSVSLFICLEKTEQRQAQQPQLINSDLGLPINLFNVKHVGILVGWTFYICNWNICTSVFDISAWSLRDCRVRVLTNVLVFRVCVFGLEEKKSCKNEKCRDRLEWVVHRDRLEWVVFRDRLEWAVFRDRLEWSEPTGSVRLKVTRHFASSD